MGHMQDIVGHYRATFNEHDDPRTREWFLMSTPWIPLAIIGFYLYFVLYFGPRYMANRKPYSLSKTIIVINVIQVVVNMWIVKEHLNTKVLNNLTNICITTDYSDRPEAMRVAQVYWVYLMMKVVDLSDTILMALRKKYNQMSVLHLSHHVATLCMAWLAVKLGPGGNPTIVPEFLNAIVHVFVYGYYLLASLGPTVQPYLWWKKYLTTLQIIQLCIMAVLLVIGLLAGCNYPMLLMAPQFPLLIGGISLFINFYRHAYCGKQKTV